MPNLTRHAYPIYVFVKSTYILFRDMNLPAQKCIATFDEHSIYKELLQLNISRIYPFTLPVKKKIKI